MKTSSSEPIFVGVATLEELGGLKVCKFCTHPFVKCTVDKQISAVVKLSFLQLWVIAKVKPYLLVKEQDKIFHAFIISHLDYCMFVQISRLCSVCSFFKMQQIVV